MHVFFIKNFLHLKGSKIKRPSIGLAIAVENKNIMEYK